MAAKFVYLDSKSLGERLATEVLRHQREGTHIHRPCTSDNDCPACRVARFANEVLAAVKARGI